MPRGNGTSDLTEFQETKAQLIEDLKLEWFKYIRLSLDMRRVDPVNKNTVLAYRFNSGIAYAYGPNQSLPYEKFFFAGLGLKKGPKTIWDIEQIIPFLWVFATSPAIHQVFLLLFAWLGLGFAVVSPVRFSTCFMNSCR